MSAYAVVAVGVAGVVIVAVVAVIIAVLVADLAPTVSRLRVALQIRDTNFICSICGSCASCHYCPCQKMNGIRVLPFYLNVSVLQGLAAFVDEL